MNWFTFSSAKISKKINKNRFFKSNVQKWNPNEKVISLFPLLCSLTIYCFRVQRCINTRDPRLSWTTHFMWLVFTDACPLVHKGPMIQIYLQEMLIWSIWSNSQLSFKCHELVHKFMGQRIRCVFCCQLVKKKKQDFSQVQQTTQTAQT